MFFDPARAALFLARHLLAFALLAGLCFAVGRRLLGRLEFTGATERWAVALATGLGALGELGFGFGVAGLLRPGPLLLAAVVLLVFARPALAELGRDLATAVGAARRRPLRALLPVAVAMLLGASALYPPTAWDETTYHLPLARAFVEAGGYVFAEQLRVPVFPLCQETLFAAVWPLGGAIAAHQVEALATFATAVLLLAWGRRRLSPAGGRLAAAILLGSPIVVFYAGTAYIDPGLMLFATAVLYACDRWQESGERRWLLLAGGFAGCAAASKYLGLPFFAALPISAAWGVTHRRRWVDCGWALLVGAAIAAPWYGRIVWWTGNPVFPFLPEIFGGTPWGGARATGSAAVPFLLGAAATRLLARAADLLRVPWDALFDRARLNQQPPISPFYLAALPALLLTLWRRSWSRPLAVFSVTYALPFTLLPADLRYLLPIAPVLALLIAALAEEATAAVAARAPAWRAPLAMAIAIAALLPGPLYAAFHLARLGPLPMDAASRTRFLSRRLPLYPAIEFLNRTRGSAYALYTLRAEPMIFFVAGRAIGEWTGPAPYAAVWPLLDRPSALADRLAGFGADHLLVPRAIATAPLAAGGESERRFDLVYEDEAARVFALRPPPRGP